MPISSNASHTIVNELVILLGHKQVKIGARNTEHYRSGWRSGQGHADAVIFPKSLVMLWRALKLCVEHQCIIIMQAAKTGLTEGSTPSGDHYDRPVVVVNTLALNKLHVINNAEQVISLPGTTLHTLEKTLKPLDRAPHSIIGSSCLGASIVGGVANNSGGALVKRGPAYTELALFARVTEQGQLELVNHLDIDLGSNEELMLHNLEHGNFDTSPGLSSKRASASDYTDIIRAVDEDTPSRYNADPSRLYEASGCAGKLAVFAVRLDTFPIAKREKTFYIGTNNPDTLTTLRHHILSQFTHLPEVGEYLHKDCFSIAKTYGKDTFLSVKHLGTDRLPTMFAIKGRIDAVLNKIKVLPQYLTDRAMQAIARCFPDHMPQRLTQFHQKYTHHLIVKMSDDGIEEAKQYFHQAFSEGELSGEYFECNDNESSAAFLHRFAAAGAAIRYQLLHQDDVGDMLALDIALRRNEHCWVENLPAHIDQFIDKKLYYGHFFCHVFHQDYILKKGADKTAVKNAMLAELDKRGAKYPAEHNVGHLYEAETQLKAFYASLDPTNTFNPGIGNTPKHARNCSCCHGM